MSTVTFPESTCGVRDAAGVGDGVMVCTRSGAVWNVPVGSGCAAFAHAVASAIAQIQTTRAHLTPRGGVYARGVRVSTPRECEKWMRSAFSDLSRSIDGSPCRVAKSFGSCAACPAITTSPSSVSTSTDW